MLVVVSVVCVLPLGCRGNGGKQLQSDLYQRELRLQEDEIYRLEDCLCEYQDLVRGYRAEVAVLKRELESPSTSEESTPAPPKRLEPLEEQPAADLEFSAPDLPEQPSIAEPPIDDAPAFEPSEVLDEAPAFEPSAAPSVEELPAGEAPPFLPGGASSAPLIEIQPYPNAVAVAAETPAAASVDTATSIIDVPPAPFAPARTKLRPLPAPGALENVRLSARLERATDQNTTMVVTIAVAGDMPFAGRASVMLIDPRVDGPQRYVARWDFTPEEVAIAGSGGDIELPAVIPEALDLAPEVQLWTRLVDLDGVKTLSTLPLTEALRPQPLIASTVAATTRREDWRAAPDADAQRRDTSLRLTSGLDE